MKRLNEVITITAERDIILIECGGRDIILKENRILGYGVGSIREVVKNEVGRWKR